jgi:hypothetical protein
MHRSFLKRAVQVDVTLEKPTPAVLTQGQSTTRLNHGGFVKQIANAVSSLSAPVDSSRMHRNEADKILCFYNDAVPGRVEVSEKQETA